MIFLCPAIVMAAVSLPYSESFTSCGADTTYAADSSVCGTQMYNNVVASCGGAPYLEGVVAAANYPGGGGGRGWRHYNCGSSVNTGYLSFDLAPVGSGLPEVWVRWYMRYEPNMFSSFGWIKIFRANDLSPNNFWMDIRSTDAFVQTMGGTATPGDSDTIDPLCSACGWAMLQDGSWHSYEFHFKDQTGTATSDGTLDFWVDGINQFHTDQMNFSSSGAKGTRRIQFFSNMSATVGLGRPGYNDIDDVAAATPATGSFVQDAQGRAMIGPIGWGGSPPTPKTPKAPTGLTITY